jgi:hypothetical protein
MLNTWRVGSGVCGAGGPPVALRLLYRCFGKTGVPKRAKTRFAVFAANVDLGEFSVGAEARSAFGVTLPQERA